MKTLIAILSFSSCLFGDTFEDLSTLDFMIDEYEIAVQERREIDDRIENMMKEMIVHAQKNKNTWDYFVQYLMFHKK